jgi:protoporphyrinogen oxidase
MSPDEPVNVEVELARVLEDLKKQGIVTNQELISWHSVTLDPAYVHIHSRGQEDALKQRKALAANGVHSAGRYGAWKYCSIEDNIIEARALAKEIA